MDFLHPTLESIIWLLEQYGYVLLFIVAMFEGPIITVLGAFLASQLYFNVFFVYAVVVAADITGDVLYYSIGRLASQNPRWYRVLGIDPQEFSELRAQFRNHLGKTLITGKFTQTGFIVLPAAGASRMPLIPFIGFNLLASLPKSLAFVLAGFFFGSAFLAIDKGIRLYAFVMGSVLILAFAAYLYHRKKRRSAIIALASVVEENLLSSNESKH